VPRTAWPSAWALQRALGFTFRELGYMTSATGRTGDAVPPRIFRGRQTNRNSLLTSLSKLHSCWTMQSRSARYRASLSRARPADDRRAGTDLLARHPLGVLGVADGDCLAALAECEIEEMPRQDNLLERYLVDGGAMLVEMPWGVEMWTTMPAMRITLTSMPSLTSE
jgi:hypothetical protein